VQEDLAAHVERKFVELGFDRDMADPIDEPELAGRGATAKTLRLHAEAHDRRRGIHGEPFRPRPSPTEP
jgi:hypothetical protein